MCNNKSKIATFWLENAERWAASKQMKEAWFPVCFLESVLFCSTIFLAAATHVGKIVRKGLGHCKEKQNIGKIRGTNCVRAMFENH